uniref:Transmembrane protein n=1 Tax=Megaselia scalaris TaxID=36166 RepID=T1GVJ5_MEGSC
MKTKMKLFTVLLLAVFIVATCSWVLVLSEPVESAVESSLMGGCGCGRRRGGGGLEIESAAGCGCGGGGRQFESFV